MMDVTSARWADADRLAVVAVIDGVELRVPDDPENRRRMAVTALAAIDIESGWPG